MTHSVPQSCLFGLLLALMLASANSLYRSNPPRKPAGAAQIALRPGLSANQRITANINQTNLERALVMYAELTGRTRLPGSSSFAENIDSVLGGRLSQWHWIHPKRLSSNIQYHADGLYTTLEVKRELEQLFRDNGIKIEPQGSKLFRVIPDRKKVSKCRDLPKLTTGLVLTRR